MPTEQAVRRERARQFGLWCRRLRRDWPGPIPVNVRYIQTDRSDVFGRCRFNGRERARIMVYATDWRIAVDTLIHEWAHYLLGEDEVDTTGNYHTPAWGQKHAELIRWFEGQS